MFRRLLVLACAVLLAGCYDTRSEHPIGTTAGLKPDKSLVGIWKDDYWRQDTGDTIHIFVSGDSEMTAVWIEAPAGKFGSFHPYRIATAKLGNNRFINVTEEPHKADDKAPVQYQPALYTLRNDGRTFTLYTADDEKVAKAIETGAIRGIVEKHTEKHSDGTPYIEYDKVVITAAPTELDAFMAKPEAADLFRVYMVFKKIE